VSPRENLISNIGYEGTHSDPGFTNHLNRAVGVDFETLVHPDFVARSEYFDTYHFRRHFQISFFERLRVKLSRIRGSR
jgi:hypothetical protein